MGWFWADETPRGALPPHPIPLPGATPPPACPMHKASPASPAQSQAAKPNGCPIKHDAPTASATSTSTPESTATPSYISKLNPLNYMPTHISNKRESSHQNVNLSLDREASTIPRGGGGTWEYPSPQQMYNAMLRKGYTDTPAEHVTSMVAVHNFLNEGAWEEIRGWEGRFAHGLLPGWEACKYGEEGAARQIALQNMRARRSEEDTEPTLLRFMGRPSEMTPKARMLGFMAKVWPSQYPDNPPFDRHDWFVERRQADGRKTEVRYVIDYYSGPPEPTGEPVFYLDVRPAIDSPTSACERMMRWGGDVWYRAMGGSVREELARRRP